MPRNLPGVLKISATSLYTNHIHISHPCYVCVFVCVPREENPGSRGSCRVRVSFFLHVYAHLVLGEYLGHVLIQPVEFVPRREGKLLDFGMRDLQGRGSLLCDPWRGADGQTRPS